MIHSHANVLVHIKEELPHEVMKEIAASIHSINGVVKSEVSSVSHILIIDYDSEMIKSKRILDDIVVTGIHAELIGL